MNRALRFSFLILLAALLASCSSRNYLLVETTPPNAEVYVNNEFAGRAPVRIGFDEYPYFRKGRQSVSATTEGYHVRTQDIHNHWFREKSNRTVDPRTGEKGYRLHMRLLPVRERSN